MVVGRFAPTPALANILWPYLANPSVAGLLMIVWLQSLRGIRRVLGTLVPWPVRRTWPMLVVVLLLPLVWMLVTFVLLAATGGPVPAVTGGDLRTYFYVAIIEKGFFFGPGLIEEIGWRGFALPQLQRRYSALTSSLVIGLVWALWHVPGFVAEGRFAWWSLAIFIPHVIGYSIIFTWIFNTTGGSLLACILLHGAINAEHHLPAWYALPDTARTQLLVELPSFCMAMGLVWWRGCALTGPNLLVK